jgi:uncharacterized protein (TIGR02246 family)
MPWKSLIAAACLAATAHGFAAEPAAKDEAVIRAAIDAYVAAYNRRDARTIAAQWSETGEWVNPAGHRVQGRAAIEKKVAQMLAGKQAGRLEVLEPRVRFIAPDVAVEEGIARVMIAGQTPADSTYVAVHVKKDGVWKLDSIRETDQPEPPPINDNLQQLEWLVGRWGHKSAEATLGNSVAWSKNRAFLIASFSVAVPGLDDFQGTLVIGWDPVAKSVRSWMFDSDGGFGEGTWTRDGNRWSVKFNQTLSDGRKGSATNIYTQLDANSFTWQSIDRKIADQPLPNVGEVKVIREGAAAEKAPVIK